MAQTTDFMVNAVLVEQFVGLIGGSETAARIYAKGIEKCRCRTAEFHIRQLGKQRRRHACRIRALIFGSFNYPDNVLPTPDFSLYSAAIDVAAARQDELTLMGAVVCVERQLIEYFEDLLYQVHDLPVYPELYTLLMRERNGFKIFSDWYEAKKEQHMLWRDVL